MTTAVRECVMRFAEEMERKLSENDHKGGWDRCSLSYLVGRLKEEVNELEAVVAMIEGAPIHPEGNPVDFAIGLVRQAIPSEAADVANFAMMISDVAGIQRTQERKAAE